MGERRNNKESDHEFDRVREIAQRVLQALQALQAERGERMSERQNIKKSDVEFLKALGIKSAESSASKQPATRRSGNVLPSLSRQYPESVVCVVDGDSMAPTLEDDDYVLVDVAALPRDRDIAVVTFKDNGRIVGRFHQKNETAWLSKDNPDYPIALPIRPGDRIEGVVRAITSRLSKREEV